MLAVPNRSLAIAAVHLTPLNQRHSNLLARLPSRPLRNWFLAWHIASGDPAKLIAEGFDLAVDLVVELLDGAAPLMIDQTEALR